MRYVPGPRPSVTFAVRMPLTAASFKPLKKAKVPGLVGCVDVKDGIASMTMCEWPVISPLLSICCGAEK